MIRKVSTLLIATLFAASCATSTDDPNAKAKRGAAVGATVGAIAGAIIGNQVGNNRTGAVVGAAAGAAIGGAVGHKMDKQEKELREIPGVEVTRPAENQIDIRLTSDILFDYDSSALRPESRETLHGLAANFSQYPDNVVEVGGHTDSMGTDEYNFGLSERRANSVVMFLIENGVPASNISYRGYGETQPKDTNDTPEGRQLNRRVEISIHAPEQQNGAKDESWRN